MDKNAVIAKKSSRPFACRSCGHRLRFNTPHCGDCYAPTPPWNRRVFWVGLVALAILGLLALLMSALAG